MTSQFTNNYDVEEVGDQAQMMRRDKILNQLSEQAQTTNFFQETGTQVKNIAQGAADRGKNLALGAAEAVKNTIGALSPRSAAAANKEANQPFKTAADSLATGTANNASAATNPTTTAPSNPNDSRV